MGLISESLLTISDIDLSKAELQFLSTYFANDIVEIELELLGATYVRDKLLEDRIVDSPMIVRIIVEIDKKLVALSMPDYTL